MNYGFAENLIFWESIFILTYVFSGFYVFGVFIIDHGKSIRKKD